MTNRIDRRAFLTRAGAAGDKLVVAMAQWGTRI